MTRLLVAILVLLVAAPRPSERPAPSTMGVDGIEKAGAEPAVVAPRTSALRVDPRPSEVPPAAGETAQPSSADTFAVPPQLRGRASWVDASYGSRYLAARMPKGTVLRITGPLGSVTRVVMDYGPSKRLHPDRIVDLSRRDFARICGDPILLGTCRVRVRVVNVVPPETDTEGE